MISHILAVIMMALGVATGNVSSNVYKGGNAFYDAENTKPVKKANYTDTITTSFSQESEWHQATTGDLYYYESYKYYIASQNASLVTHSPTYVLPNMMIYNSVYTFSYPSTYFTSEIWYIYKLINIYDGQTKFETEQLIIRTESSNTWNQVERYAYTSTDESIDEVIDISMNASSRTQVNNKISSVQKTTIYSDYYQFTNQDSSTTIEVDPPYITLEKNEIKYLIILVQNYKQGTSTSTDIVLYSQTIKIDYVAPTTNYEVIDVPNLMYTVLTMPFSFISTAFNLTIFPNTAYALNFGNLFLTIVAIFILLWIIKKVFH